MKNLLKLSALAAVVVGMSATLASAATITLNSSATETKYAGFTAEPCSLSGDNTHCTNSAGWNTAAPVASTPLTGGVAAAAVTGALDPWSPAFAGSVWVSNDAENGPHGLNGSNNIFTHTTIQNGLYTYYDNFMTTGGTWTGSLSVMADDTTAIYLNGQLLLAAGLVGGDSQCSDATPTCTKVATIAFGSSSAGFVNNGANQLEFVVEQTGFVAQGLDYTATISNSTVPEPSTLLMFGTGLIGSAGALFRRMRS